MFPLLLERDRNRQQRQVVPVYNPPDIHATAFIERYTYEIHVLNYKYFTDVMRSKAKMFITKPALALYPRREFYVTSIILQNFNLLVHQSTRFLVFYYQKDQAIPVTSFRALKLILSKMGPVYQTRPNSFNVIVAELKRLDCHLKLPNIEPIRGRNNSTSLFAGDWPVEGFKLEEGTGCTVCAEVRSKHSRFHKVSEHFRKEHPREFEEQSGNYTEFALLQDIDPITGPVGTKRIYRCYTPLGYNVKVVTGNLRSAIGNATRATDIVKDHSAYIDKIEDYFVDNDRINGYGQYAVIVKGAITSALFYYASLSIAKAADLEFMADVHLIRPTIQNYQSLLNVASQFTKIIMNDISQLFMTDANFRGRKIVVGTSLKKQAHGNETSIFETSSSNILSNICDLLDEIIDEEGDDDIAIYERFKPVARYVYLSSSYRDSNMMGSEEWKRNSRLVSNRYFESQEISALLLKYWRTTILDMNVLFIMAMRNGQDDIGDDEALENRREAEDDAVNELAEEDEELEDENDSEEEIDLHADPDDAADDAEPGNGGGPGLDDAGDGDPFQIQVEGTENLRMAQNFNEAVAGIVGDNQMEAEAGRNNLKNIRRFATFRSILRLGLGDKTHGGRMTLCRSVFCITKASFFAPLVTNMLTGTAMLEAIATGITEEFITLTQLNSDGVTRSRLNLHRYMQIVFFSSKKAQFSAGLVGNGAAPVLYHESSRTVELTLEGWSIKDDPELVRIDYSHLRGIALQCLSKMRSIIGKAFFFTEDEELVSQHLDHMLNKNNELMKVRYIPSDQTAQFFYIPELVNGHNKINVLLGNIFERVNNYTGNDQQKKHEILESFLEVSEKLTLLFLVYSVVTNGHRRLPTYENLGASFTPRVLDPGLFSEVELDSIGGEVGNSSWGISENLEFFMLFSNRLKSNHLQSGKNQFTTLFYSTSNTEITFFVLVLPSLLRSFNIQLAAGGNEKTFYKQYVQSPLIMLNTNFGNVRYQDIHKKLFNKRFTELLVEELCLNLNDDNARYLRTRRKLLTWNLCRKIMCSLQSALPSFKQFVGSATMNHSNNYDHSNRTAYESYLRYAGVGPFVGSMNFSFSLANFKQWNYNCLRLVDENGDLFVDDSDEDEDEDDGSDGGDGPDDGDGPNGGEGGSDGGDSGDGGSDGGDSGDGGSDGGDGGDGGYSGTEEEEDDVNNNYQDNSTQIAVLPSSKLVSQRNLQKEFTRLMFENSFLKRKYHEVQLTNIEIQEQMVQQTLLFYGNPKVLIPLTNSKTWCKVPLWNSSVALKVENKDDVFVKIDDDLFVKVEDDEVVVIEDDEVVVIEEIELDDF